MASYLRERQYAILGVDYPKYQVVCLDHRNRYVRFYPQQFSWPFGKLVDELFEGIGTTSPDSADGTFLTRWQIAYNSPQDGLVLVERQTKMVKYYGSGVKLWNILGIDKAGTVHCQRQVSIDRYRRPIFEDALFEVWQFTEAEAYAVLQKLDTRIHHLKKPLPPDTADTRIKEEKARVLSQYQCVRMDGSHGDVELLTRR